MKRAWLSILMCVVVGCTDDPSGTGDAGTDAGSLDAPSTGDVGGSDAPADVPSGVSDAGLDSGTADVQPGVDASDVGGDGPVAFVRNEDCRLFDDYCTGCDCRALAAGQPNPTCPGQGVQCLVAPCQGKTAACQNGICVATSASADLQWYRSCGDPVCGGYREKPNVPKCTTEMAGAACGTVNQTCDPVDNCNAVLVCTTMDPTMGPGGCPISQRSVKRDIEYLTPADLRTYRDDLMRVRLAKWRYKAAPERQRLGFIIEDLPRGPGAAVAVDGDRGRVDLYGYTSLAVATVQQQARELDALRQQIAVIKRELRDLQGGCRK